MQLTEKLKQNPLRALFDEGNLAAKIRKSLYLIIIGNICGSAHGIICGGGTTAMIGLATELGANDMMFGILAAIPQICGLMQLPFSVMVNRTHQRKKYMMTYGLFSRVLWLFFGLVPYIFPMGSATFQLWTIVFLLGIASCCGSMINVCWFPWLSDLLPLGIRGRFLSIRESIVSACNVLIGLLVALVLDNLAPDIRYIIIFLIGGTLGIIDMFCFGKCEDIYTAPKQDTGMLRTVGQVFRDKAFVKLIVTWSVWCFTANLSGVYLNPYSMNEMGLSFTQIMVFSTIASALVSVLVMPHWGKLIDRYGCKNVMLVACSVAALTPLFYLFSSPGNILPTLLHNVIGAAFWCGANLACSNMQLNCSPSDTRPTYLAVFSVITALSGATLGSLAGGALLENWRSANLFVGSIDRYQALFVLSVVLRFGLAMLLTPRLEKDSEISLKQMLRIGKR